VDSLVPFAVVVETVFLITGKRGIVLGWSLTSDLGLIFDGVKDLVNRKLQLSEVFY